MKVKKIVCALLGLVLLAGCSKATAQPVMADEVVIRPAVTTADPETAILQVYGTLLDAQTEELTEEMLISLFPELLDTALVESKEAGMFSSGGAESDEDGSEAEEDTQEADEDNSGEQESSLGLEIEATISQDLVTEYYGYISDPTSGLADLVIIKPGEGSRSAVREALRVYQEKRIREFENYDILNSFSIAKATEVFDQGDYVILLMLPDNDAAREIIDRYMPL